MKKCPFAARKLCHCAVQMFLLPLNEIRCALGSRTSGSHVIKATIEAFLGAFRTPSEVLEASNGELESFIDPLGLQETRIKAVKQMSQAFFEKV